MSLLWWLKKTAYKVGVLHCLFHAHLAEQEKDYALMAISSVALPKVE